MKKFISILILLNFLISPSFASIVDSFAEHSLDKSLQIKKTDVVLIEDDLAKKISDKTLTVQKYDENKHKIKDSFASNNKNAKHVEHKPAVIVDTFLPSSGYKPNRKVSAVIYSEKTKHIEVPIRILDNLTTKSRPEEGDYLTFETVSDIKIKNTVYPKGTPVKGRIETVSMNTSMGVPSDLIIANFQMGNIPLYGEIKRIGANRSLWVYPCVYAGSIFFGAGLILAPIRGGHAKIKTDETFTLYAKL